MLPAGFLAALLVVAVQPPDEQQKDRPKSRAEAWQPMFDRAAEAYAIYRDREHSQRLQVHTAPLYKWKAASAGDGLFGSVYVWTYRGCPESVASLWRSVEGKTSLMKHELHSLSEALLEAEPVPGHPWTPKAGLPREPIDSAPTPAAKAPARLAQMRRLANTFSGYTEAAGDVRRELRLLPAPLYRYESTDPDVVDGALFAFVCSVGTDPEAFLLLEARQTAEGPRWRYALARFSHADTFISFDQNPVWKSVRGVDDTFAHSADYTYVLLNEPVAEPEPPAAEK
ncbi:MAG TPA: hypothetical protein VG826_01255 [Pirellulales bacterium]|nr:hypothetical protein [Pirellulales bacterium]